MVRIHNGVSKTYSAKPALTPEKVQAVRFRYNERIQKNCIETLEFSKRFSDAYFNKLLNGVLSNIARKQETNCNGIDQAEPRKCIEHKTNK